MVRIRVAVFAALIATLLLAVRLAGQGAPPETGITQEPSAPSDQARQQPPVTFKLQVDYVEVDAIVTDEQGNFVDDLTQADFEVLEDGEPQDVSVFALVDIPIERAERPLFAEEPLEPDVRTNRRPFDGRLYLMVLDDLHTSPLRSGLVKVAARRFIEEQLGANDLVAVVHTSGRADASQEFTSNRRRLLEAVNKFIGRKLRSSTAERIDRFYRLGDRRDAGERIDDPLDFERGHNARLTLDTLQNLAEWLGGIHGRRKTLLFISEGIDYDIYDIFNARYASTIVDEARDTIGAATRANTNIYAIDPRGLTSLGDDQIEIAGPTPADPTTGIGPTSLQDELRLAQDSLRVLADETGGFAVLNTNDFRDAFARIVRENSSYYILGYYPNEQRRDGKLHAIEVRVNRPGLRVRARKGYVAPRGRAPEPQPVDGAEGISAALREVIANPLPVSGLTLATTGAAFRGPAPNASVAVVVEVEGADLTFTERDGIFLDDVELSVAAYNAKGEFKDGDSLTAELKLQPQTFEVISRQGLRLTSRLELPPGRYQLRVAAHETGGGSAGSVHFGLDVPDFSEAPLSISHLVLTSGLAAQTPTLRPDPLLKDAIPGPPTTIREFVSGDTLAVFAEVYDNEASKPHRVDITTTVRAEDGRVVFQTEEERSSKEIQGPRGGYGHTAQVPLKNFPAGLYVVRVEGRSWLGDGITAHREVPFRIRP